VTFRAVLKLGAGPAWLLPAAGIALIVFANVAFAQQGGNDVLALGSRLELFVDAYLIDTMNGDTRQGIRRAVNTAEIAFGIVESHRQGGARVALPLARRDFWMHSH